MNFEQYSGPGDTSFTGATIKQGLLTVSGGAIAKYAASGFYDTSSIYLTIGGSLPPEMDHYYFVGEANQGISCSNCSRTLTLNFSQPVSNFSFTMTDGAGADGWTQWYELTVNGTPIELQFFGNIPSCINDGTYYDGNGNAWTVSCVMPYPTDNPAYFMGNIVPLKVPPFLVHSRSEDSGLQEKPLTLTLRGLTVREALDRLVDASEHKIRVATFPETPSRMPTGYRRTETLWHPAPFPDNDQPVWDFLTSSEFVRTSTPGM